MSGIVWQIDFASTADGGSGKDKEKRPACLPAAGGPIAAAAVPFSGGGGGLGKYFNRLRGTRSRSARLSEICS